LTKIGLNSSKTTTTILCPLYINLLLLLQHLFNGLFFRENLDKPAAER